MRRVVLAAVSVPAVLVAAAWLAPLPPGLERPVSQVVLDSRGGLLRMFTTEDGGGMLRVRARRDELPDDLVNAVIAFEDRRFFHHPGVDPIALVRAAFQNATSGRVVSGGSTITMQVARMLERRPRTLSSKVVETFRALQLELRFDKDEILAFYFNLAPYGGNVEGAAAAAWFYFGKEVGRLSLDEAATLAAIPNSPERLRPDRGAGRLRRRRDDVLARMVEAELVDPERARIASSVPVQSARRPLPFEAPHLTRRLHAERASVPVIRSAIDPSIQHRVERLLADHVSVLSRHGIDNGAVVVIENETRAVRAYVGSQAFFDARTSGQVDGAAAERSPGSTLKPFVYAAAFDRGLIGERTLLEDVPVELGEWAPGNFDGRFRGVVSARDALALSLNVPAVKLAQRLEPEGLAWLMERAGVSTFAGSTRGYGLAAVLGGCDVTLLELTNLYATIAQAGLHRPVRMIEDGGVAEPVRLFSDGAAYLTGEILTDVERPELPDAWRRAVSIPRIAWKTGTSYGRRDAWSIGYDRRWTVGVWTGNFDGRGVPELVGVRAAAPLLFAIFQTLPGAVTDRWIARPAAIVTRQVCALSGAPASASCPHTRSELAIAGVAPAKPCALHQTIDVDDETGARLCSRCRSGRHYHAETHVVWPASVVPWLAQAGLRIEPVPAHNASCPRGLSGRGPVIHTPGEGDHFVLRDGVPAELQQIPLQASTEGDGGEIHWFVDGALLATAPGGRTVMLDPTPGPHHLVAVDPEGRKTSIRIRID